MMGKQIEKERVDTDAKLSGLGKFKSEDFEASEDCFHNLLYQKTGTTKADLRYVICNRVVPAVFLDVVTERMYQIRLSREAFGEDKRKIFWMLKEYQMNSPVRAWI